MSFNPHPARRPDAMAEAGRKLAEQVVSILTRPEGRMLFVQLGDFSLYDSVSILTRPEGRML